MNASKETFDMKVRLSILWIFVMFNYLYCDVMTIFDSAVLKELLATGQIGPIKFTQGFLLGVSILMEIPIAMILLSWILKYTANRWANVIGGTIMTLVQCSSLFFGTSPTMYYMFFSSIEIVCTVVIVWQAWKWSNPEAITAKLV
jgi:hypothetical protein